MSLRKLNAIEIRNIDNKKGTEGLILQQYKSILPESIQQNYITDEIKILIDDVSKKWTSEDNTIAGDTLKNNLFIQLLIEEIVKLITQTKETVNNFSKEVIEPMLEKRKKELMNGVSVLISSAQKSLNEILTHPKLQEVVTEMKSNIQELFLQTPESFRAFLQMSYSTLLFHYKRAKSPEATKMFHEFINRLQKNQKIVLVVFGISTAALFKLSSSDDKSSQASNVLSNQQIEHIVSTNSESLHILPAGSDQEIASLPKNSVEEEKIDEIKKIVGDKESNLDTKKKENVLKKRSIENLDPLPKSVINPPKSEAINTNTIENAIIYTTKNKDIKYGKKIVINEAKVITDITIGNISMKKLKSNITEYEIQKINKRKEHDYIKILAIMLISEESRKLDKKNMQLLYSGDKEKISQVMFEKYKDGIDKKGNIQRTSGYGFLHINHPMNINEALETLREKIHDHIPKILEAEKILQNKYNIKLQTHEIVALGSRYYQSGANIFSTNILVKKIVQIHKKKLKKFGRSTGVEVQTGNLFDDKKRNLKTNERDEREEGLFLKGVYQGP